MKTPLVEVHAESELHLLLEHTHDRYFELDRLWYDDKRRIIHIPFESERRDYLQSKWYNFFFAKWRVPVFEYILEIQNVLAYAINDRAEISSYTLNNIHLGAAANELRIVACEDLEITMHVERLRAAIISTDKFLGTRSFLTVLGCEFSSAKWLERATDS